MEREELVERLKELKGYVNQSLIAAIHNDTSQATFDLWADRRDALEEAIVVVRAISKNSYSN